MHCQQPFVGRTAPADPLEAHRDSAQTRYLDQERGTPGQQTDKKGEGWKKGGNGKRGEGRSGNRKRRSYNTPYGYFLFPTSSPENI